MRMGRETKSSLRWLVAHVACCGLAGVGCNSGTLNEEVPSSRIQTNRQALTGEQSRVLGFETPTVDWSVTNGAALGSSATASEGTAALSVSPNGWTEINSISLSSLGTAESIATIDVRLPAPVYWGEVRLILVMPSQNVWWREIGSKPLSGLTAGTYHTLSFPLDGSTIALLSGTYQDLRFKIIINAPPASSPYLLDNLVLTDGGTPLDTDSEVDTDTDTDSTAGDAYVVRIKTPRSVTFDKTVLGAETRLKIGANVKVESPWLGMSTITSLGTTDERMGEPDADLGNIWSKGPVDIGDRVHVRGSIYAPSTTMGNNVVLDGAMVTDAVFDPAEEAAWNIIYPSGGDELIWLEPNQTTAPQPGKFSTVRVGPNAIIELHTGTYYIDTLTLEADARLVLDQEKGPVIVYVRDHAIVRSNITAKTGDSPDWLLVYLGSESTSLDKSFSGTVIAPNAELTLHSAHHTGAFFAKDIIVDANAIITHRPGLGILTADDEGLDECIASVPPQRELSDSEMEIAHQLNLMRYCLSPGLDSCLSTLYARAATDRTRAVLLFMNGEITGAQYVGLARDRTDKLYRAEDNPAYAQSLCTESDLDDDWVVDSQDLDSNTPELFPTDDDGKQLVELPVTPDDDDVREVVNKHGVTHSHFCDGANIPGLASVGGFYWPEDSSKGVYIVMAEAHGQPPGCPVYYQFEINGVNKANAPVHLFMTFRAEERVLDLVGLGRPIPVGLIEFQMLPTDSGDRGVIANDIKPYNAEHRVRAYNGRGLTSAWSDWKKTSQKDCLSLGFRCREGE